MKRIQYTVREIPAELDRVLRERMRTENVSLNTALREALRRGCGLGQEVVNREFDDLAGKWVSEDGCESLLEEMRSTIDRDLWQ
jgi:hypothetical protein